MSDKKMPATAMDGAHMKTLPKDVHGGANLKPPAKPVEEGKKK